MAGDCKLSRRLPRKLLDYLMPFQKTGVEYAIEKNGKCLIADEMGLGKTIQAIAVACFYREEWPVLVIVPSSLRYPWVEELEKWLPDVHPHDINLIQSGTDASGIAGASVTLVTFGLLSSRSSVVVKEALKNQKFKVVIVDESHYIRNFRTVCSQSVVPLVKQAHRSILLSGTPALSRPVELYPQLDALLPGKFGNWWKFTERYCDAQVQWFGKQRRRKVDGASNLGELQTRLTSEVMIRREKKDVLTQLPPKQRQRILFDLKESDLKTDILETFEELKPYLKRAGPDLSNASSIVIETKDKIKRKRSGKHKQKEETTVEEFADQTDKTLTETKTEMLPGKQQTLSTSVSHPRADREIQSTPQPVRKSDSNTQRSVGATPGNGEKRVTMLSLISKLYKLAGEAKIGPVKDYVSLLCENHALKFLVFAYHHAMMDGIQQTLWESKVKFIRIDGNTKPSERLYFVQQFQADPDCRVAILSILAAGVGLTFTAAKLVMFAEMYWTPGVMVQCEDRAHRLGQTSCVPVHYLVAKGTMDEWVWSAVCKKTTVVTATLNGRVQSLEADEGDKYQVEVLSNAEAWVPSGDLPDMDLTSFFQSQQPVNQRSIKDFLTSSQDKTFTPNSRSEKRIAKFETLSSTSGHCRKRKLSDSPEVIAIISSEEELEDGGKKSVNYKKKRKFADVGKHQQCIKQDLHGQSVVDLLEPQDSDSQDFSSHSPIFSRKKLKFTPKTSAKSSKIKTIGNLVANGKKKCKSSKTELSPISSDPSRTGSGFISSDMDETDDDCDDQTSCTLKIMRKSGLKDINSSIHAEKASDKTAQKWDCSVCTYLNHSSLPYCEMCETPKKQKVRSHININTKSSNQSEARCNDEDTNDGNHTQVMISPNDYIDMVTNNSHFGSQVKGTCNSSSARKDHEISSSDESESELICESMDIDLPDISCRRRLSRVASCHVGEYKAHDRPQDTTLTPLQGSVSPNPKDSGVCINSSSQVTIPANKKIYSKSLKCDIQNCPEEKCDTKCSNDASDAAFVDIGQVGYCENKESGYHGNKDNGFRGKPGADSQESSDTMNYGDEGDNVRVSQEHSVTDDTEAAIALFSQKGEREEGREEWLCPDCNIINPAWEEHCDGCLASKPDNTAVANDPDCKVKRVINLDRIPVHKAFSYCCSKYTGRIYLFDKDRKALHVNFLPLDVSVGNVEDLPDILLHPANMRVVRRFIEEWNKLGETKRRFVIRHTDIFQSPIAAYEQLKTGKAPSINRHLTKEAVSVAAVFKAQEVEGSVRVIAPLQNSANQQSDRGITQVLNKDGIPLCVNCQKAYENPLLKTSTIQDSNNAWYTRFCSPDCSHNYWMKTHNDYSRGQIFELERGICQLCKLDAHSVFRQIRDTPDVKKRAMILMDTVYCKQTAKQKASIVQNPTAGQFWHVDHIVPVWEGGGECDIDNLRTLCTPCHQKVTAEQTRRRNRAKKLGEAVGCRDIASFFKPSGSS